MAHLTVYKPVTLFVSYRVRGMIVMHQDFLARAIFLRGQFEFSEKLNKNNALGVARVLSESLLNNQSPRRLP